MTKQRAKIPRGLFDPNGSGMLDPNRVTPAERKVRTPERLAAERQRRESPSPVSRKLQAASDRAIGRAGR